jgi:phage portal protein BeeE
LVKVRDELNRWLAPQYGPNICIEFDFSMIPEMSEDTDKVVDQLSKAWWITPNEKREMMSYGIDEENEQLNDYFYSGKLNPNESRADGYGCRSQCANRFGCFKVYG